MKPPRHLSLAIAGLIAAALGGCAAAPPPPTSAAPSGATRPATLLVLPPVDDSLNVAASPAVWASATRPLAEAGYYVLPAVLVDETLRRNGIETPQDAQEIPFDKLRSVFAADAAIYIEVKKYGTRYSLLSSETGVDVTARVVDLRSGATLWSGESRASSGEMDRLADVDEGVVRRLVASAIRQVVDTTSDASFKVAGEASRRLFDPSRPAGMLPGPRAR